MKNRDKNLRKWYGKLFTLKSFIRDGYFDFQSKQENKNLDVDIMYGKTDIIDIDTFNFDTLVNNDDLFSELTKEGYKTISTSPIIFSIPKTKNTRRILKFPNLYNYMQLANYLDKKKEEIINRLVKDKNSTSKYFGRQPFTYSTTKNIQTYFLIGHLRFYKTDLSKFYHTFYTHCIEWLVEGKENSKLMVERGKRQVANNKENIKVSGRMLDKIMRNMQNSETYGVPTGSLLTRIVMELVMTYFDEELKKELGTNIDFTRYVDDFFFGYETEEELSRIKKSMENLITKYNLQMNDTKTTIIEYYNLKKDSNLVDFFDRSEETNYKQIRQFLNTGIKEISEGIKGSDKLLFTSLRYLLEDRRKNSDKNKLKKLLHTFTRKNAENLISAQATIMEELLEIVFLTPKAFVPFMQLIKEIERIEKIVGEKEVTLYLTKLLNSERLKNLLVKKLEIYCKNEFNQEAYVILTLCRKFKVLLDIDEIEHIFQEKIYLDDLNYILILENLLKNEKISSNQLNYFLEILQKKLIHTVEENAQLNLPQYFTTSYWMLKYQILYWYVNSDKFKNRINEFNRKKKIDKRIILDGDLRKIKPLPDVEGELKQQKNKIKNLMEKIKVTNNMSNKKMMKNLKAIKKKTKKIYKEFDYVSHISIKEDEKSGRNGIEVIKFYLKLLDNKINFLQDR